MIRAINASIDAIVREIKRSEHNNSVSIETMFYLASYFIYLVDYLFVVAFEEESCFSVSDTLAFTSFL
jgi:hypothetical protein